MLRLKAGGNDGNGSESPLMLSGFNTFASWLELLLMVGLISTESRAWKFDLICNKTKSLEIQT